MSTYREQLRDPRWQKKRLEIMNRDDFRCRDCDRGDITLNVHHTEYVQGAAPWQYPDSKLLTLCEDCHQKRHPKPKPDRLSNEVVDLLARAQAKHAARVYGGQK